MKRIWIGSPLKCHAETFFAGLRPVCIVFHQCGSSWDGTGSQLVFCPEIYPIVERFSFETPKKQQKVVSFFVTKDQND